MAEIVNNAKREFNAHLRNWITKDNRFLNGVDVGCGTSRVDEMIVSIDQQPDYKYAHAQLVWNCHDLDLFSDNSLDFIFSSHCLEDFEDIPVVFLNWWKKVKPNGLILLLLPDMEECNCEYCKGKSRYPKTNEPGGNPSHRTNVGKKYIKNMLCDLFEKCKIKYEILQQDTIKHNESCSIDFVIKKIE